MGMPTWTLAQAKLSVEVNGTYVPFRDVPDAVQRFVRPAVFSTGHDVFELQNVGTAFMGTYKNWRFAVTTAHQASGLNGAPLAEKFVVVAGADGKRLAVPPRAVHKAKIEDPERQSMADLIFYDYTRPRVDAAPQHLDLSRVRWSDEVGAAPDYSFLIGFPSQSARITLEDSDDPRLLEFAMRWIRQDLQPAERRPLDPEERDIFVKHAKSTRLTVDPDGLSGSPVFSIVPGAGGQRYLRFDGIVTNANADRFGVYPSGTIRDLLDSIVNNGTKLG